ncbi:MAG TPA: Mur ligase family protein [Candidatus Limnocylindria bacterium]|nr:Mur ligase family protein [Candidatus Limnocylindria bacterium]
MPQQPPVAERAELLELRVLDGPNRFFTRPAVKLEFAADTPGEVAAVAAAAGDAVRRLHTGLDLTPPRLAFRESADERRAIVAFPWRRRTIAQAIGASAARLALGLSRERRELRSLRAMALGPLATLPSPRIPIVAITGTNGKSTTTRLISHIATAAGKRVGMTNSDGIYVRGELVEAGDWTGFGGAGRVLAEGGLDLAVLETARGGILLRGIGYAANDISVVTNISADHLGLQGIDTLDELADVKAAIVRITKRDGWAVLNAQDERVWAMRRQTRASVYAFSLDPEADGVAQALRRGGRAAVLEDGWLVLRRAGRRRLKLVEAAEAPVTFAGLASYNVANALAAAAAADGLGISAARIREGLRTFGREAHANPGRLNLFGKDGRLALVDFAHNEAGLAGLLSVSRRLVGDGRAGRKVRLAIGTAGDRTDEILHSLGQLAGRDADEVVICEKRHYLRGRDLDEMNAILRRGIADGGYRREVPAYPTELDALRELLARSRPGDVACIMAHAERQALFDWLSTEGYRPVGVEELRRILDRGASPAA